MSQTPPPNDPYGTEPGAPAPHGAEPGSPTSDPALHPHDPFAYDDSTRQAPAPQAPQPPAPQPSAPQPSAGTYDAPAGGYAAPGAAGASAQSGHSPYGAPHTAPAGDGPDQPAPGTKGVYEGPLSGQPLSRSDSRMWALFSQLAVVLGHVVSWGFLGWVGPLIIFMMYKDRDRFVRFHAAEALNGAISHVRSVGSRAARPAARPTARAIEIRFSEDPRAMTVVCSSSRERVKARVATTSISAKLATAASTNSTM